MSTVNSNSGLWIQDALDEQRQRRLGSSCIQEALRLQFFNSAQ